MDYQVIMVIGLPASGKSTYIKHLQNYLLCDDFITTFFNGEVLKKISEGHKVCLSDPRLCMMRVFEDVIRKIKPYTPTIKLILFENNPEKCIINSRTRNDKRDGQKMEQCILNYSKVYLLENYKNYDNDIETIQEKIEKKRFEAS